jgi:hypothetical protein
MMDTSIQIIEKPDWVSWDEIREVLWKAHAENRERGIVNTYYSRPSDEIRKFVGDKGKMYVALDGKKVVATGAVLIKKNRRWYAKGDYAYACLGAILPEYRRHGIYFPFERLTEAYAKTFSSLLVTDMHENNLTIQKLRLREGFQYVEYKACRDHYNVVMAKWFNECPYPLWYIKLRFQLSKLCAKTRFKMVPGMGRIKRFGI